MFMDKSQKRVSPACIRLDEDVPAIQVQTKLKYLVMIFDNKMNFVENIKRIRAKVQTLANKMSYLGRKHMENTELFPNSYLIE